MSDARRENPALVEVLEYRMDRLEADHKNLTMEIKQGFTSICEQIASAREERKLAIEAALMKAPWWRDKDLRPWAAVLALFVVVFVLVMGPDNTGKVIDRIPGKSNTPTATLE